MAENLLTSDKRHTNSSYFTMVALDDNSKPVPVTPMKPTSPTEKRRWNAAIERKKHRELMAKVWSEKTK